MLYFMVGFLGLKKNYITSNQTSAESSLESSFCLWPLEGRAAMSLKACACNLRTSAAHSCESLHFVVEVQRDALPSLMCQIFPKA